ncbi:MAG: hypothetical protein MUC99_07465 [Anaerolineae bacterium]|jgi:cell division protein FtsB|nr:hypothetical protein [Anaerolineae bacterium]
MSAAQTPPTPRQSRKPAGSISSFQLIFAVVLAVGLILTINFSSRIAAGRPILEAYDEIQREIAELEAEQERLLAERNAALNDYYVEQWARGRGKMVRAGEKLIIPVPSQTTVVATPVPIEVGAFSTGYQQPENWQLWWSLFFDDPPPTFSD